MTRPLRPPPDHRPTRVLLANASRARLFERDPDNGALRERADFVHPAARLKGRSLARDRPGRAVSGSLFTTLQAPTSMAERERTSFAQQLAHELEAAAHRGELPAWALLAASPFLGRLQDALGPAARAALAWHATLDLSAQPLQEVETRLRELLPPGPPEAAGPG